jgi:flagellar biogenesis protein FliO
LRFLAQLRPSAAEAQQAAFELVLWFGGMVVAVLAAIIVLIYLRRRFLRSGDQSGAGFTLAGLKQMRERGELSEEEYVNLRRSLVEQPFDPTKR